MEKKKTDFSVVYFILALGLMFVAQFALLGKQVVETISLQPVQGPGQERPGRRSGGARQDHRRHDQERGDERGIFPRRKSKNSATAPRSRCAIVVVRVDDPRLTAELEEAGVPFKGEVSSDWLPAVLSWVVPIVIFFVLWNFLFSRMGGGASGGLMQIGKSKAKVYIEKSTGVSFADVEGIEEAKDELIEVVEFLKHPEKYQRLGRSYSQGGIARRPSRHRQDSAGSRCRRRGGRAVLQHFGFRFRRDVRRRRRGARARYVLPGRRACAEHYLHRRTRCLGKARGMSMLSSHDEREQTLNQLLAEMDGFDSNKGVIMMAATNRPEILDPALLRPGRFDRQVLVDRPDVKGREKILQLHAKKIKLSPAVDLTIDCRKDAGFRRRRLGEHR